MTTNTHTLQIEEILELLPHRFPFLLVDRVLDFEEGDILLGTGTTWGAVALSNTTSSGTETAMRQLFMLRGL